MSRKGFTLLELIIVVAIIGLLAAATFVAVNPAKRQGNAQNATRWTDITAIADAWSAYLGDHNSELPTSSVPCLTGNTTCMIANYGGTDTDYACTASTTNNIIWLDPLVNEGYIGKIPNDPKSASAITTSTGYYFAYDSVGKLTVGACDSYNSQAIKVVR
ncbi:MAG: hypothetical protein C3F02_00180 [Parcubacteria group bacterium]|nr:MAG: hypothetical protein C3F02_00180 [Parcubacteria group bacterium]